jgi:hypothetical protein
MATHSSGSQFRRWDPPTKLWQIIGQVYSIEQGFSRRVIEDSDLNQEAGCREYIGGLRTSELSLGIYFERESFEILRADFRNRSPQRYAVLLPDEFDTIFGFYALIRSLPLKSYSDKVTNTEVELRVSGLTTISSAGVAWEDLGVNWIDTGGVAFLDRDKDEGTVIV